MTRKLTFFAIMNSVLLAVSVAIAPAQAETTSEPTLEQSVDQAQAAITDAWLDGKLESALLFNGYLDSFDIDTDVQDRVAFLSGAVESDIDRDLAGEIAKSINGIKDVENNLVVDEAKATMADRSEESKEREGFKRNVINATLTARVKSQLLLNNNTSGMAIDVDSKDGIVTLSGEVGSRQEKELAALIAANAEGARSVRNNLTVEPKPTTG